MNKPHNGLEVRFSFIESPTLQLNQGALSNEAKGRIMAETSGEHRRFATKTITWDKDALSTFLHSPVVFSGHQFRDGIRNSTSYKQTNVLVVDLDDHMTPGQAIDILSQIPGVPYYHLSFSSNHKPGDKNKMHVVIPLTEPVTSTEDHDLLAEWVLETFIDCDQGVRVDVARGIIRSNKAFMHLVQFGGDAPLNVKKILDKARQAKIEKEIVINQGKAKNNKFYFDLDTSVYDEHRKEFTVQEMMHLLSSEAYTQRAKAHQKIPIYCPICGFNTQVRSEDDPRLLSQNAFIRIGENGLPYIYCSSCASRGEGHDKNGSWFLERKLQAKLIQKKANFYVFRDMMDDIWYHAYRNKRDGELVFRQLKSFASINHVFARAGAETPEITDLPQAEFALEFDNPIQFDFENEFVNKFTPSQIMIKVGQILAKNPNHPLPDVPKWISHLIFHISGDDTEMYNQFLDWLAYIYQYRQKTRVAFLFQGSQGTGKDFMLNRVMRPIFGENYVAAFEQDRLASQFNTAYEDNIIISLSEVQTDFSSSEKSNKVAAIMKMLISDEKMSVEGKFANMRKGRNNANVMAFSNKHNAVMLERGDRRFNVCPRQEVKMVLADWFPHKTDTDSDGKAEGQLFEIDVAQEIEQFALHLALRPVTSRASTTTIFNDAKKALMSITRSHTEDFFDHTQPPHIDWNWLDDAINDNLVNSDEARRIVGSRLIEQDTKNKSEWLYFLSKKEAKVLYENIVTTGRTIPINKFNNFLLQFNLKGDTQVIVDGERKRPIIPINYRNRNDFFVQNGLPISNKNNH